jgi:hypothetical protein
VQGNRKDGGKPFWTAISCGENCTFLALIIFSTKCLKYTYSFSDILYNSFHSLKARDNDIFIIKILCWLSSIVCDIFQIDVSETDSASVIRRIRCKNVPVK